MSLRCIGGEVHDIQKLLYISTEKGKLSFFMYDGTLLITPHFQYQDKALAPLFWIIILF